MEYGEKIHNFGGEKTPKISVKNGSFGIKTVIFWGKNCDFWGKKIEFWGKNLNFGIPKFWASQVILMPFNEEKKRNFWVKNLIFGGKTWEKRDFFWEKRNLGFFPREIFLGIPTWMAPTVDLKMGFPNLTPLQWRGGRGLRRFRPYFSRMFSAVLSCSSPRGGPSGS